MVCSVNRIDDSSNRIPSLLCFSTKTAPRTINAATTSTITAVAMAVVVVVVVVVACVGVMHVDSIDPEEPVNMLLRLAVE